MRDCLVCGQGYIPGPRTKGKPAQECCSKSCAARLRYQRTGVTAGKTCEVCGGSFMPIGGRSRREQRTCSRACGVLLKGQTLGGQPPRSMAYSCTYCGGSFDEEPRPGPVRIACPSDVCQALLRKGLQRQWAVAHPERIRESAARRRAVVRSSVVEKVDYTYIAERDQWRCQICKQRVSKAKRWPHAMSSSYDHVVPLSKGGEHVTSNLRLTHLVCNVGRGNRGGGEQLALLA